MSKTNLNVIVLLAVSALLTGCGNSSTAVKTSPEAAKSDTVATTVNAKIYNPCDLITEADVKEIFPDGKINVDSTKAKPNQVGQSICFINASEEDMKYVQLAVIQTAAMPATTRAGGQTAEKVYTTLKEMVKTPELVSGLGDDAYYGGSGLDFSAGLHVLNKEKDVNMNITLGLGFGNKDDKKHLELEKKLAEKILKRL